MNLTQRRERYRAVLGRNDCVYAASVFDALSARIAEDLGFELGYMSGSNAAISVLGAPDYVVITLSEFAQQARRITRASTLSLMVDTDHGYGNALNVMRTVEEMENAGVSALSIEDTVLPTPFGATGETLISLEEGIGKMKAALAARQDASLVIAARTSALRYGGIPEAIRRAKAYEKAGVDVIHLADVTNREGFEAVHAEVRLPLQMVAARPELYQKPFLAANGVRVAFHGLVSFQASVQAMYETLRALREGKSPADLRLSFASDELLARVTRRSSYDKWVENFLN